VASTCWFCAVDGEGGLIGERLDQRDLGFGERARCRAPHGQDADDALGDPQWHRKAGDDSDRGVALAHLRGHLEARVDPDVLGPHRAAVDGRSPHETDPGGNGIAARRIFLRPASERNRG